MTALICNSLLLDIVTEFHRIRLLQHPLPPKERRERRTEAWFRPPDGAARLQNTAVAEEENRREGADRQGHE